MGLDPDTEAARVALLVATRRKQDQTACRQDLAAAKIKHFIEKTLAVAPPLTSEQRDRLAGLLRESA